MVYFFAKNDLAQKLGWNFTSYIIRTLFFFSFQFLLREVPLQEPSLDKRPLTFQSDSRGDIQYEQELGSIKSGQDEPELLPDDVDVSE